MSNYPQYPYSSYPNSSLSANAYNGSYGMSRKISSTSSSSGSSYSGYHSTETSPSSPDDSSFSYPPAGIELNYTGLTPHPRSGKSHNRQQPSSASLSASQHAPPQYPCLYPGCSHISGRPFDLQRHMKKHNPTPISQKMDCPGKGCGRVGAHGFDRKDHMTEHLRNFHMWDIPKGKGGKTGSSGGSSSSSSTVVGSSGGRKRRS